MGIPRKIGIGITMIIPAFVGAGVLWEIYPSWILVFVWIYIMVGIYEYIII
jgi:hypothetical protein